MRNSYFLVHAKRHTMAEWSVLEREWPPDLRYEPYPFGINAYYQQKSPLSQDFESQAQQYIPPVSPTLLPSPSVDISPISHTPSYNDYAVLSRGDSPREIRNKAEKQRRDRLNQSISKLASMVPPVVAANRKIDKTGVLRLTAHFLRAHQHVFGDSIQRNEQQFSSSSIQAVLSLLKGFLLTTTCKGIVVVASQNVQQYLGYSELDLLGQNILKITHQDDHNILKDNLMPKSDLLGPNGELLIPDEPDAKQKLAEDLAKEKRRFVVRFKKLSQRSEPIKYVTCSVEGSLRKSDRAYPGHNRSWNMVRRARARSVNPCSSGNDVVFVGLVRPTTETFQSESALESFKMEYRTRHSVDGEIIQCEQRIALVTGYMTHEVYGLNAMNFMHRDDVRWVIIALREMYDQHRMVGESCYRLMTKNGQFIYMKTRGCLDVDSDSRAVRTFVCTNTLVSEQEGKHLIKMMKKKFMLLVKNNRESLPDNDTKDGIDNQTVPVEDPRQLEKVILHLVTNLPSPQPEDCQSISPDCGDSSILPLAIIPPKKERIVSAIEKIYSVIKTFQKEPIKRSNMQNQDITEQANKTSAKQPTIEVACSTSALNQNQSEATMQHSDNGKSNNSHFYQNNNNLHFEAETRFYSYMPWSQGPTIIYSRPISSYVSTNMYAMPSAAESANLYRQPCSSNSLITAFEPTINSQYMSVGYEPNSSLLPLHSMAPQNHLPFDANKALADSSKGLTGIKRPMECNEQFVAKKKPATSTATSQQSNINETTEDEDYINRFLNETIRSTEYPQIATAVNEIDSILESSSAFKFNFDLLFSSDNGDQLIDVEGISREQDVEQLMARNEQENPDEAPKNEEN